MKHQDALYVARWLVEQLRGGCERVEIAGSVRRGKAEVKDIEIVAVPIQKAPRPEFGQKVIHKTPVDKILFDLVEIDGMLKPKMGGEKFRKFEIRRLAEFGLDEPVNPFYLDLFLCTPPSQWGVEFMIRTGPSDFSQWMVTQRSKGGALPDGYFVRHNVVWVEGTEVPSKAGEAIKMMTEGNHIEMAEEEDWFRFCGLEWIEPGKRVARWGAPLPAASPQMRGEHPNLGGER